MAREMLRMVRTINDELLAKMPSRVVPGILVHLRQGEERGDRIREQLEVGGEDAAEGRVAGGLR